MASDPTRRSAASASRQPVKNQSGGSPTRSVKRRAKVTREAPQTAAGEATDLLTFVSSISVVFLLDPMMNDPNYIVGSGADGRVVMGCLLDLINASACAGAAVVLFPIVKCQNEGIALGFVTSRLFEAAVIVIGIVSLLVVVTLRQTGAGGTDAELSVRSCWDTRRYPAFASRWDTPALGRTLRWLAVLAATPPCGLQLVRKWQPRRTAAGRGPIRERGDQVEEETQAVD